MATDKKPEPKIEIPGYKILKRLGRGGMAEVYLAIQESIGRKVAMKIMLPQLLTDESFSERFVREAKISATLAHPNIVSVFDVGVVGDTHYITMEFLPGGDLKDRIKKGITLPESIKVMKEICGALDFAAKMDFVHRDIKPENILFSQTGAAVLSDFGIARGSADGATNLTMTGSVIGTPHFMSPEQAQGKKVDGRSDLYSMGIVFYQMLTGRLPYDGDSAMSIGIKHIRDPIPDLPEEYAKYKNFLDKLVAKEPNDRWQTGADVVRTLEVLEAGGEIDIGDTLQRTAVAAAIDDPGATMVMNTGQQTGMQTGVQPPQKKGGMGMVLAVLVVAALAGGGYMYTQGMIGGQKTTNLAPSAEHTAASTAVSDKVQTLLAGAAEDVAASRYVEPKGQNAAEKFRAVLVLDDGNESATRGLQQISDIYANEAEDLINQHKLNQARTALKTATELNPANPRIAELNHSLSEASKVKVAKAAPKPAPKPKPQPRKLTKEQKREQERQQQLKTYLSEADRYLDPVRMSSKRLEKAYDLYRKAYRISPRDSQVEKTQVRIADGYQTLADELRAAQQWKAARHMAKKGLSVLPGHRRLVALERQIRQEQQSAAQTATAAEPAPAKKEDNAPRRSFGGF